MRDAARDGTLLRGQAFEIADRDGPRLLTVPFDALIRRDRLG